MYGREKNLKKILIVTQYFYPENFIINSLALTLAQKNCEIHVYTGYPTYPNKSYYKDDGLKNHNTLSENIFIHRFPIFLRRKGRIFLSFHYISYLLMGILFSYKIIRLRIKWSSIFVFQISPITVILIAAWLKFFTGARLITWVQDLWPGSLYSHFYSSSNKYPLNQFLRNMLDNICLKIYSLSDLILAQSVSYRDDLKIKLKNKKVDLVFNSINDENLDFKNEKKFDKDIRKLNIISAGNFSTTIPYKVFIKSIILLKKTYGNDVNWNFYGNGTQFEYFKSEIIKNKLDDVVNIHGSVDQTFLPEIMMQNDLFILGLIDEPLVSKTCPSRLIYAMANAMPIIACAKGEISRIVLDSKCGFVSEPNDHKKLVENINKFIATSHVNKELLSLNSKSYYNNNFSRKNIFDKIHKLL